MSVKVYPSLFVGLCVVLGLAISAMILTDIPSRSKMNPEQLYDIGENVEQSHSREDNPHTGLTVSLQSLKEENSNGHWNTKRLRNTTSQSYLHAVFGCSTPLSKYDYNYAFLLPLTALAWQRIGFRSVVIIVGTREHWLKVPVLRHVLKFVEERGAIIVFLDAPVKNQVMLSQVSRLFAQSLHEFEDTDYLLTTDSDLWPFHKDLYMLPENKRILSLNSKCCPPFVWEGQSYAMLPMGNIAGSAATWRDIMGVQGHLNVEEIVQYFVHTFGGNVPSGEVIKGSNLGWYMDQRMVSIKIHQWSMKYGADLVHFVPRNAYRDRIDRSGWKIVPISTANDSHLLHDAHKHENWKLIQPLLVQMYGNNSSEYDWCEEYFSKFTKITT